MNNQELEDILKTIKEFDIVKMNIELSGTAISLIEHLLKKEYVEQIRK